jgi:threonine synthase
MFRCARCAATVSASEPLPFRCPNASNDDRHHVLHRVADAALTETAPNDPNPFLRWAGMQHWWRCGLAHGIDDGALVRLCRTLDDRVHDIDGRRFVVTPVRTYDMDGRAVDVKDETDNVSGSHKARHLFGTMLSLLVAEEVGAIDPEARPHLAIASCGNAALGAATVAAAARWPLDVYVPVDANPWIVDRLRALRASVTFCQRSASDPPGDPCIHRFHEALDADALPFSVQGPENALALDGGRTIGWELAASASQIDRLVVQTGGGALVTSLGFGLLDAGLAPTIHAVQAQGCAPLAAAWECARRSGPIDDAASHWSTCMRPWINPDGTPPHSAATGILDDETYDWVGASVVMAAGGGRPIVVGEDLIERAHRVVDVGLHIDADHTGAAAMAGYLALADAGSIGDHEHVVVTVTGVRR